MAENKPVWKSVVYLDFAIPLVIYRHGIRRNLPVGHRCKIRLQFIIPHEAISTSVALFGQLLSVEINLYVIFDRCLLLVPNHLLLVIGVDRNFSDLTGLLVPDDSGKLGLSVQLPVISKILKVVTARRLLFENKLILPDFISHFGHRNLELLFSSVHLLFLIIATLDILFEFLDEFCGGHDGVHLVKSSVWLKLEILVSKDVVHGPVLADLRDPIPDIMHLTKVDTVMSQSGPLLDHVPPVFKVLIIALEAGVVIGLKQLVLADVFHDSLHEFLVGEDLVPFLTNLGASKELPEGHVFED